MTNTPQGPQHSEGPDEGTHGELLPTSRTDNSEQTQNMERFENPGMPAHVHRHADVDPRAAKRAERQVATMFVLSMLGTVGFIVAYFAIDPDARGFVPGIGDMSFYHLALGLGLAVSLLGIGFGAVHWAKTLMPDEEMVEERHVQESSQEDQDAAAAILSSGYRGAQLHRRPLLLFTAGGALSLFALPLALQVVGGLGPLPGDVLTHTNWRQGRRLMIDPAGTPVRPEQITQGSVVHIMPEGFVGEEAEHELDADTLLTAKSKDSVILVRLNPEDVQSEKQREWGYEGIFAYSKICTHVGCPVALYEQQTHHLLCPCHQSTFDMTDDCKVIFGPAKRALPQLRISVDDEGYLQAEGDFAEPIGPSYWERG